MFTLLKGWEVLAGSLLREGGDDDEREDVQKKTFAKWINSQLVKNGKPLVSDLFSDLRDGEVLLSLLEILTAQQYIRFRLKLFRKCSGCDACAGLVWSIILHWQVQYHLKDLMTELQQTSLERTLLAWCRAHTQFPARAWCDRGVVSAGLRGRGRGELHVVVGGRSGAERAAARWRPALFAWEALAARAPRDRLDHAFALAHDYLGIDRLLDPEGTRPPLACDARPRLACRPLTILRVRGHAEPGQEVDHDVPDVPVPIAAARGGRVAAAGSPEEDRGESDAPDDSEPSSPNGGSNLETSGSRPLSAATTGSGELGAYGAALEDALAWLLDAEERLAARAPPPPAAPLPDLKEHFHTHEVSERAWARCWRWARGWRAGAGAGRGRGRGEGALSAAEAREVRLQRRLLAARWETLRRRGMERQAAVHAALMRAQRETRDDFRQWLTATEDRISQLGPLPGDTPERAAASLAAVEQLHQALRHQQPRVDALADCVLVLDDDDDDHADVVEMEDELRALGERWSHTCQWTLAQLGRLRALRDLQPTDAEERLKQDERRALAERWSHTCQWTLAQLGRLRALRDLQPTDAEERLKQDERRALGERWSHTCQWTLAQLGRLRALRDLQPTDAEERLKQVGRAARAGRAMVAHVPVDAGAAGEAARAEGPAAH
ncbi:LOW QUALITY PROTEIN: hypothetical protein MSG28_011631 [Choristoneura fumiferana]|uniref:Uncharacterized protein n=1 Tax=Choristoneura fumiferana TaxID=7141 RepID=A0ACC0KLS5_CHOFU|nr:LOW QUALITY PROTEIN: hypothetical protein MSG28_011631 [Choristoneura fumiferana]